MGFAKVQVCTDNDIKLNPPGKFCAPLGTKHLPGGMQRSQSNPSRALVCPGGSADIEQRRLEARSRRYQEDLRNTWTLNSSMSSGSWPDAAASIRPSTSSATQGAAGGGWTQGAVDARPSTTGTIGYDRTKHGWYHPTGQTEQARLAGLTKKPTLEPGTWAWTMLKARDHNGYGDDGMVTLGDIQNTGVSGDTPDWLVGTRSLPGPFGTHKFPVRRCPLVSIEGRNLRVRAKTYKQGPCLNTIEILHDSEIPPTPLQVVRKRNPMDVTEHQARQNNIELGGCQTKKLVFPPSTLVTYETHDPRHR